MNAISRFAGVLLAGAAPLAISLPALTPAVAQVPAPVEAPAAELAALPAFDLAGDVASQLAAHQARLQEIQATLIANPANAAVLQGAVAELQVRIQLLQAFANPLPALDLAAPMAGLQDQLSTYRRVLGTYESALATARAGNQAGAAVVIDARISDVNGRITQLEAANAAAMAAGPAPAPEAPAPAPAPEPAPTPAPAPAPAPTPAPAPAADPAATPAPTPAPAAEPAPTPQPAPAAGPAPTAAQAALPPLNLAGDIQQQLAVHQGRLEAARTAGDANLVAELELRIRVLEFFVQPLPALNLEATQADLRTQLDVHAALVAQADALIAAAQALPGAGEALETRRGEINERIGGLQARLAAAPVGVPAAPPAAPGPAEPVVPTPPAEPGAAAPVAAPATPPAAGPGPAEPVVPTPAAEPAAAAPDAAPAAPMPDATDLEARINAYLGVDLPEFNVAGDAATLEAQLTATTELQALAEALLAEGRVANLDVTALAQRMGELQLRISLITTAIGGTPATAVQENPIAAQLELMDAATAEEFRTLRAELEAALGQIGAAPQQQIIVQQQTTIQQTNIQNYFQENNVNVNVGVVVVNEGDRFVLLQNDEYIVWRTPAEELNRLLFGAADIKVEDLGFGFTRTIILRNDGTQIITITDAYGQVVERTRIEANGIQIVLIANLGISYTTVQTRLPIVYFEQTLPPLQLTIPLQEYVVEAHLVTRAQITATLLAPPVEVVERAYTIEEIRYSERLRDKMRSIDLTNVTFEFGSAIIAPDQFDELTELGLALEAILIESPNEVFLIEGHTDAVGSEFSNLLLSDRRAEAIALALSQNFAIPPENLITQGYGESFLKVPTLGEERENRRGVVRRITPLLAAG